MAATLTAPGLYCESIGFDQTHFLDGARVATGRSAAGAFSNRGWFPPRVSWRQFGGMACTIGVLFHLRQNRHDAQAARQLFALGSATHATYSACEFVYLLERRITITPDGGEPAAVNAGDAFVVAADFMGTWKIEEKFRKYFDFRLK